ncbi:hypothetical protein MBLNU230_g4723t1 [Neophaeotheca triangularis]
MSSSNQLAQSLQSLSESLKTTNTLILRLAKLTFQPGTEGLDEPNTVRVELSQDIHESLKQHEEDLELVKQEVADLTTTTGPQAHNPRRRDSERDRERNRETARLESQVVRLGEDLTRTRNQFRRAQITAKRASEAAKLRERELLFQSLQKEPPTSTDDLAQNPRDLLFAGRRLASKHQQSLNKDELAAQASSDVTSSLRRTHDLLSTELSRSRFAQETFDQSTAALAQLGESYNSLDNILSTSRNLLGTLLRSQKSDTWYLETAFRILLATFLWLVFRRLLFGPFIKLPLFLYKVGWFLTYWILLKPFLLFLTVSGVITTETKTLSPPDFGPTSSRAPLIVKPSAQGGIPTLPAMPEGMQNPGQPAGAGGSGAKLGKGAYAGGEQKLSEEIGKMAEQSAQGEKVQRRGDGTILEERGDTPKNPKKKMFEAGAEEGGQRRKRDEL